VAGWGGGEVGNGQEEERREQGREADKKKASCPARFTDIHKF